MLKRQVVNRERTDVHKIITRRSSLKFFDDSVVNLGIGFLEMITEAADQIGVDKDVNLTVKSGVIGGVV